MTILLVFISAFLFFGAANLDALPSFDLPAVRTSDIRADGASAQETVLRSSGAGNALPLARKDWTVMVFMNAKNNLDLFYLTDIAEMEKVGTTPSVNIVTEYGASYSGTVRMLVGKRDGLSSRNTVYGEYPDADMGDYRRVIEFVNWSKTNFPARKYMLVLWNHGLGWIDPNTNYRTKTAATGKGILFDDETGNYVRTRQLGDILRATGYVDILAMNACLMQMAEVAYEVKDNAGLLLASEETMLITGYDYEKLLAFMNSDPAFTDEQFSDFITGWYRRQYSSGLWLGNISLDDTGAALSTVRPGAMNDLPEHLDPFTEAVMRNNERSAVKTAVADVLRFSSLYPSRDPKKMLAPYVDLYDLASIIKQNAVSHETRRTAEELMSFIRSELVVRSAGMNKDPKNGYDYSKAGGIAINMTMKTKDPAYTPMDIHETLYSELGLSKASGWDEFLTWTDLVWRK